jgi:uncharacterized membrane protein
MSCCARRSVCSLWTRPPEKRQMIVPAEATSIRESRPNPSNATDPAITAAMIPTLASMTIHRMLSHESVLATRTSRACASAAGREPGSDSLLMS